jgi:hypothetical protein
VRPLASDPDDLIVLEVVVGTRGPNETILPDAVRLVTIEARQ